MADYNRLPGRFAANFRRAANASEAVTNMMTLYRPDYNTFYENFLRDVADDGWVAAQTNGTAAAVTYAGGLMTLTSGTDDNGYAGQMLPGLFWNGDNGVYMQSQMSLDVLTTVKIEAGFTDASDDAGAMLVKATPTSTATECTVICFDTDDNTQLDVMSSNGDTAAADAENIHTLVAATDIMTEFRVQNNLSSVFLNGLQKGGSAIEGGTSIAPWFFVQSRAGAASRVLTVNYVFCTGPNGVAIL